MKNKIEKQDLRLTTLELQSKEAMTILQRLDERMEHMDHIIRGNGSPGLVTQIQVLQTKTDAISLSLAEAKETATAAAKSTNDHTWQWVLAAGSVVLVEVFHWLLKR